jgi:hypothetical protein
MDKVYVVQGSTGEYSDRLDWIVKAFRTKEEADKFQQDITDVVASTLKYLKEKEIDIYDFMNSEVCVEDKTIRGMLISFMADITNLDSKFQMDYTGTYYWITGVELAGTSNT